MLEQRGKRLFVAGAASLVLENGQVGLIDILSWHHGAEVRHIVNPV